jgi:ABC-type phosphate/phosphonate transport system permease subunit
LNWNRALMIFILICALVLISEWVSANARGAVT